VLTEEEHQRPRRDKHDDGPDRRGGRRGHGVAFGSDSGLDSLTAQLAGVLRSYPSSTLRWHIVPMPEEKHATIYHPAALRAFRTLFKP
jgi:uncharacterized protein